MFTSIVYELNLPVSSFFNFMALTSIVKSTNFAIAILLKRSIVIANAIVLSSIVNNPGYYVAGAKDCIKMPCR